MAKVNTEMKKVVNRVKEAQEKLQTLLKNQDWMEEVRKYAERQGKEAKKLLSADASKVKTFLERERKELEKFQKQIPGEVKKLRTFVLAQRKEFEKLLANVRKFNGNGTIKTTKKKSSKSTGAKKKSSKKASAGSESSTSA